MITKRAKNLLLAMSIGDGHVRKNRSELQIKHSLKQKVRTQTIPSVPVGSIKRMYECSATEEAEELYEDMLRAYTYDDGEKILHIEVVGE